MKVRQQAERWRDELARYFAGLDGAMGLRSWLGRWEDHGPTRGGTSMATAPEHDGAALEAARVAGRVEYALRSIGRRRATILAALHAPRKPWGLDCEDLAGLGWVVLVVDDEVEALLAEVESVEAARRARLDAAGALSDPFPTRRVAAEGPLDVPTRLRALVAAHGAPERRVLRRVATVARRASGEAHVAFGEAWVVGAREERATRVRRLQMAMEGVG